MNKALGLIETIGLVCAIEAADSAVKAANVKLLGYENTKGGGKITVKLTGDVGAVQAAVAAGVASAQRIGKVYGHVIIARPHEEIGELIHKVDRGLSKKTLTPQPKSTPVAQASSERISSEIEVAPTQPASTSIETVIVKANGSIGKPNRCAALTMSGEPCKLLARPGSQYCNIHHKLEPVG